MDRFHQHGVGRVAAPAPDWLVQDHYSGTGDPVHQRVHSVAGEQFRRHGHVGPPDASARGRHLREQPCASEIRGGFRIGAHYDEWSVAQGGFLGGQVHGALSPRPSVDNDNHRSLSRVDEHGTPPALVSTVASRSGWAAVPLDPVERGLPARFQLQRSVRRISDCGGRRRVRSAAGSYGTTSQCSVPVGRSGD
jgi:hypothetical protein